MQRTQKITLGEMRAGGQRGFIVFCSDYRCSHNVKWPASEVDKWPDHIRISNLELRFVCKVCGRRGANIQRDCRPTTMGTN